MTTWAVGPWELHFRPINSSSERKIQAMEGKNASHGLREPRVQDLQISALGSQGSWLIQRPQDPPPQPGPGTLPTPTKHRWKDLVPAGHEGHKSFFIPDAQPRSQSGWPAPGSLPWFPHLGTSAHPTFHPECVSCPFLAMGFGARYSCF